MKNINRLTSAVNNKRSQQTVKNIKPIQDKQQESFKEKIKLHPVLKEWGIELNTSERSHLKNAIVKAKKVLDPLLLAEIEGEVYLVDGHNRYEIIQELDLPAAAWEVALLPWVKSIQDAVDYMMELQQGRRNWTKQDLSFIRGQAYAHKKDAKAIAKQYKVGEATIFRDFNFFKGISKAPNDIRVAYLHSHEFADDLSWLSHVGMGHWQKLGQQEQMEYEEFFDNLLNKPQKEKNKSTVNQTEKLIATVSKFEKQFKKEFEKIEHIDFQNDSEKGEFEEKIRQLQEYLSSLKTKIR
ncbi:hypothetical protein [Persicobacter diffluens]|uniref:ParB/Sulfiredoxin domain-containing protein n=1 Tax=Persicobacter diffluens TaxID=981 RepID=A0AAN5AM73_9BACT|nr:hypothetical protein PEDI_46560 [Persicobacter diffluens]